MKLIKIKQGTRAWETARETRIGSSEVFDIVRYYATDSELQNCGLNAEEVRNEKPFTTAWALYHKILQDGIYQKGLLPPELADYGHAVEPYGFSKLQEGRQLKLRRGEVYADDRCIASLDISGISEDEADRCVFNFGGGKIPFGKKFVCEQKSIMPSVLKDGLPIKYIIQAQYQITMTDADFFILQIMILDNDTVFERGKITQIAQQGKKRLIEYLDGKIKISKIYFNNNEQLAALIKVCLNRFFADVDSRNEPKPFLPYDKQKGIIESLRINSFYNKDLTIDYDLMPYVKAKEAAEAAEALRLAELQKIIDVAKEKNASKFKSLDGHYASFAANGALLVKSPKEDSND